MENLNETKTIKQDMTYEEIAEKFCSKCDYEEVCESNGNYKNCHHAKRAITE